MTWDMSKPQKTKRRPLPPEPLQTKLDLIPEKVAET
jgi:hypothetical protein